MKPEDAQGIIARSENVCDRPGPGFKIVNSLNDTSAQLVVGGAGPIGAVLLQCASGEAKKLGGFLGAQETRR